MARSSTTSSSSSTAHHGCVSRYSLVVFVSAFLLVATSDTNAGARTVEAWSLNPFHGRRGGGGGGGRRRHRGSVATTTTKSTAAAVVDGRLFYQDGVTSSSSATEDTSTFMLSVVDVSRAAAIPTTATATAPQQQQQQQQTAHNMNHNKPKSIFLPRRSPSRQELQRRKQLLDTELVVGRFAMVTAIVMAVGEILAMTNSLLQ